jgi:putative transposase
VLLRLAYLTVTNTFAVLRLLPASDQDKDTEILVLRHQIAVLERQLGGRKVRFTAPDRALLAALLHRLSPAALRGVRLLVRPDTVLRWHRDLIKGRHAARSKPKRAGPAADLCVPSASRQFRRGPGPGVGCVPPGRRY